jgi:hypothetical protein
MTQPLLLAMPDSEFAPVTEDAAMDLSVSSNSKGNISEKLFEVGALRRGWSVATNSAGAEDFDHVIKRRWQARGVVVQTRMAFLGIINGKLRYKVGFLKTDGSRYSETAFDVLAVHLPDTDEFIFFTRVEIGARKGTTYTRREQLSRACNSSAMDFRDPNNWHLLNEVAESLTPTQ